MEIFPKSLQELWDKWQLRVMILLSLSLQIILIGFGHRRKYITRYWIRLTLWLAYLSADWVATVALGVLSNNKGDSKDQSQDPTHVIMAFWVPFILLNLGGPDTITAYSLEDNELWRRHLLGLVVQVVATFYVFIRSLKPTNLNFVAIPMFVGGIVKYGERTWVLRTASSKQFRQSLLPRPDPGPNYAKFMDEHNLKALEGFELSRTSSTNQGPKAGAHNYKSQGSNIDDDTILNDAYEFFKTYKRLFADLILGFQDLEKSQSFFQYCSWNEAYRVIEVELGFVFDVLYTKASVVYSIVGVFLRSLSLSSCGTLIIGAIGLEIYAILLLLLSDWTRLWLSKQEKLPMNVIYKVISGFRFVTSKQRWSNCMSQYNLISSCFKAEPADYCGVLQSAILDKIIDHSILLWHIATDLCYYSGHTNDPKSELSKLLSDYLMYILVKRSSMLPNGIGLIRFQDTYEEALEFVRERKSIRDA